MKSGQTNYSTINFMKFIKKINGVRYVNKTEQQKFNGGRINNSCLSLCARPDAYNGQPCAIECGNYTAYCLAICDGNGGYIAY